MPHQIYVKKIRIERPVEEVFAWHERDGVFERLLPPWEKLEVLERTGGIRDGARSRLRLKIGPMAFAWLAEHEGWISDRQFRDVQRSGPFAHWRHTHRFETEGPGACCLTDEIEYKLPGGALGQWFAGRAVERRLARVFSYRHAVTEADLELGTRYGAVRSMRIVVSGASGLVGEALVPFLRSQGHEVVRLVRRVAAAPDEVQWDPDQGEHTGQALRGADVVIHLAGENVASGRWSVAKKARIRESRVRSTRALVHGLGQLKQKPFVFVSASATGYYGPTADAQDESAPAGNGFLADVCQAWETEASNAEMLGIRTVLLRTGVVLSPRGGMLGRLLPVFRAGLGGTVGQAGHWLSWIGIDDLVGAIYHAILDRRCQGPLNLTAPEPVTSAEFARILGRVLRRPALLPVPAFVLRAVFGEMAGETLLASARVLPTGLQRAGYGFRQPKLEAALRHLLGVSRVRRRG